MRAPRLRVLLIVVACSPRAAPVEPSGDPPAPASLPPSAGVWQIAFGLDSTRNLGPGAPRWLPARNPSQRVVGRLWLSDSAVGQGARAATLEIDFAPLLGRPMSCFPGRSSAVQVVETDGIAHLWFTPDAYDCGFSGQAKSRSDTMTGTWEETSFVGSVANGRFWMHRK
jgi:hypothetical protein